MFGASSFLDEYGFSTSPIQDGTLGVDLGRGAGVGEADGGAPSLPCLNRDNCNGDEEKRLYKQRENLPTLAEIKEKYGPEKRSVENRVLTGTHRKTAFILLETVKRFAKVHGIEKVGFLTLTFKDHVIDAREAQRRFHSLATGVLNQRYKNAWLRVMERQKSGRIHYHLLVAVRGDIRTGVDIDAIAREDYRTATAVLRSEWAFWNPKKSTVAKRYGFGRTELMPIKSTDEAIGKYVGKYIQKHLDCRFDEDKGVRLVAAAKGVMAGSVKFAWNSPRSQLWRAKIGKVAEMFGFKNEADFEIALGKKWAYFIAQKVHETTLLELTEGQCRYPSAYSAVADGAIDQSDLDDENISGCSPIVVFRPQIEKGDAHEFDQVTPLFLHVWSKMNSKIERLKHDYNSTRINEAIQVGISIDNCPF